MNKSTNKKDLGLLLIRAVIGVSMFAFHGLPKLSGGTETWEKVGNSMSSIGITFFPIFWGFAATLTESIGALLIIIGLWTRPTSALLAFTMLIATIKHLAAGDSLAKSSHPIELMAIFIALLLLGPGKYSMDKK